LNTIINNVLKYMKKNPFNIRFHKKISPWVGLKPTKKNKKIMKQYEDLDESNSAEGFLLLV
jgi:hypothetical protein